MKIKNRIGLRKFAIWRTIKSPGLQKEWYRCLPVSIKRSKSDLKTVGFAPGKVKNGENRADKPQTL